MVVAVNNSFFKERNIFSSMVCNSDSSLSVFVSNSQQLTKAMFGSRFIQPESGNNYDLQHSIISVEDVILNFTDCCSLHLRQKQNQRPGMRTSRESVSFLFLRQHPVRRV